MDIPVVSYPKPWLLFWTADILAACYFYYAIYRKWCGWARGMKQPPARGVRWRRAVRISLAEIVLQRQLFALSPLRWLIHFLIFWGFTALALLSLFVFVVGRSNLSGAGSGWRELFLNTGGYIYIKIWGDSFGLALLVGLAAAGIRRLIVRSAGRTGDQTDVVLLLFLLWLTLSGFALEGLRLCLTPPDLARYSFVAAFFVPAGSYTLERLQPWLTAIWVLHSFSGLALFLYLPHSKLLHSILAPVVIAMNASEEEGREDMYWPDVAKHRPTRSPKS